MIIVIECEACQSRYRLSKSLFKDSRAIRVRCRKCGGYIVVKNPDLPETAEEGQRPFPRVVPPAGPKPEPPVPAVEPKPEAPPPEAPEPETPMPEAPEAGTPAPEAAEAEAPPPEAAKPGARPPMDETTRAMADLLYEFDTEQAGKAPEAAPPPDLPPELLPPDAGKGGKPGTQGPVKVTPYPDSPDGSEALASALEELFKSPPAGGPAPGPEWRADRPAESAKAAEPRKAAPYKDLPQGPRPRAPYASPLFIFVVLVWLLLLAAAALFFGTDYFDKWFPLGKSRPAGGAVARAAPQRSPFEIRELNWFTDNAYEGGMIFAVTGTVTNLGAPLPDGIRIRTTIMSRDNAVISEKVVFAGNQLDNTTLRATKREIIDSFLTKPVEERNSNPPIANGETLPFMAVFFDPPEKVYSVVVKAVPPENP